MSFYFTILDFGLTVHGKSLDLEERLRKFACAFCFCRPVTRVCVLFFVALMYLSTFLINLTKDFSPLRSRACFCMWGIHLSRGFSATIRGGRRCIEARRHMVFDHLNPKYPTQFPILDGALQGISLRLRHWILNNKVFFWFVCFQMSNIISSLHDVRASGLSASHLLCSS